MALLEVTDGQGKVLRTLVQVKQSFRRDFGDLQVHVYFDPGVSVPRLVITGRGGCMVKIKLGQVLVAGCSGGNGEDRFVLYDRTTEIHLFFPLPVAIPFCVIKRVD